MTAPATFTRRSARVEAMRLDGVPELEYAADWLEDRGVASSLDRRACVLWITTPLFEAEGISGGIRTPAQLGQWITYVPQSGEVAVWPDDKFRIEHPEVEETERG